MARRSAADSSFVLGIGIVAAECGGDCLLASLRRLARCEAVLVLRAIQRKLGADRGLGRLRRLREALSEIIYNHIFGDIYLEIYGVGLY